MYADDTGELQELISNGGTFNATTGRREVIIDRSYVVRPILLPGDLELILRPGVVIEAEAGAFTGLYPGYDPQDPCGPGGPYGVNDYDPDNPDVPGVQTDHFNKLFLAKDVDNLVIIGQGTAGVDQATIRMSQTGGYPVCSNFVHALTLRDCTNVEVSGLTIEDTGGDGIYIKGDDILVHDCTVDHANRNGITIASGTTVTVEDCVFKNSMRKSPQAGMDIEPNGDDDRLVNVRIRRCTAEGNDSSGFVINVSELKGRPEDPEVDVRFEDCTVNGAGSAEGPRVPGPGVRSEPRRPCPAHCSSSNSRVPDRYVILRSSQSRDLRLHANHRRR